MIPQTPKKIDVPQEEVTSPSSTPDAPVENSTILENRLAANTFNSALVYGATKTGKTREIAAMAMYVFEKYGKTTRLISADGGGWGSLQEFVDAGIIDAVNIADDPNPIVRLEQLSRGDWPSKDKPDLYLKISQQPDFNQIGLVAIEGLGSICELVMNYVIAKGLKINEDIVSKFAERDTVTGEVFSQGAAARGHYMYVQNKLKDLIRGFQSLSTKGVNMILFTSTEAAGEEDLSKQRILGPASIGKAATASLPQRFGDLIHIEIVQIKPAKPTDLPRSEYRAYFTPHVDADINRSWPASLRLSPQADAVLRSNKDLVEKYGVHFEGKEAYIVLDNEDGSITRQGLSKLWRMRDEISSSTVNALKEMLAAKGIKR